MPNKRKPTALKIVKGTLQPCRTNKLEPKPNPGVPEAPAWLLREAKVEFNRLAKSMVDLGVITEFDFAVFATYCQMFGEYVQGCKKKTPVSVAHITQMRLYMIELGLTPSSRSKVSAVKTEEKTEDPWDTF